MCIGETKIKLVKNTSYQQKLICIVLLGHKKIVQALWNERNGSCIIWFFFSSYSTLWNLRCSSYKITLRQWITQFSCIKHNVCFHAFSPENVWDAKFYIDQSNNTKQLKKTTSAVDLLSDFKILITPHFWPGSAIIYVWYKSECFKNENISKFFVKLSRLKFQTNYLTNGGIIYGV